eukprot:5755745-Prymnesium_polylepis.2
MVRSASRRRSAPRARRSGKKHKKAKAKATSPAGATRSSPAGASSPAKPNKSPVAEKRGRSRQTEVADLEDLDEPKEDDAASTIE